MSTLAIRNVRKRFDDPGPWIVDDLSLDIASGELVSLLGPSGCGKTTVLRMIAGLEFPNAGDILIDGKSVVGLKPGERDIALVFQQYALYPNMTVAANLEYPLKALRIQSDARKDMVNETASLLGLTSLLERMPGELSGGEQQRVAVGRALIRKPRIYLLDEPLANLDAKLRLRTRALLKELQRETATTCIVVTHDQSEAMALSDRIAVMDAGRLQQVGTPDEVYRKPANAFVAGFVGSPPMNLVSATRQGSDLVTEGGIRVQAPHGMEDAGHWTLGVRPEDLHVTDDPTGAVSAVVVEVEPQGHETLITAMLGDTRVWVRSGPDERPDPGRTVFLNVRRENVHLFDPGGSRVGDR